MRAVRTLAARRGSGAAGVHRGVSEHRDLQAGVRMDRRLRARRRRARRARGLSSPDIWSCSATMTTRARACPPAHAADRLAPDRSRRCARQGIPRRRRPARSSSSSASSRRAAAPGACRARPARGAAARGDEHGRPPGRLGEQIRCVVSVSMLTEGWDTNTVTHILGVRAFGTQLLCEQVVGRGLRRQSYEPKPENGPVRRRVCRHHGHSRSTFAQPQVAKPTTEAGHARPRDQGAGRAGDRLPARQRLSGHAAFGAPDGNLH